LLVALFVDRAFDLHRYGMNPVDGAQLDQCHAVHFGRHRSEHRRCTLHEQPKRNQAKPEKGYR
jgi:hypothetical protein